MVYLRGNGEATEGEGQNYKTIGGGKMNQYYILNGHETAPVNFDNWVRWFKNTQNRHVADEKVGDVRISTVFLGLDHSWDGPPPLLFETMVFGGPLDMDMERYTTWKQAEDGHKRMVERVKNYKQEEKNG